MFEFLNQNLPAKFVLAFVIVLGLIALTAWLVRRFGANRLGGGARGRQPRLAVIDAASVDGRRKLVLIRRDNVEHLMMIGGPNDLVVEPNIVRASAARDTGRDQFRAAPQDRQAPAADTNGGNGNGGWPLQPSIEPPAPVPPQAPARGNYRAPVTDEPWVAPEPQIREPAREPAPRPRQPETGSISGMAAEFNARLSPDFDSQRPAPVREPAVPPAPAAAPPPAQSDRNLAEMAQRLEAALRRPNARDDVHPPATDPLAAPIPPKPARAEPKIEPKLDFKPEPKIEPAAEARSEPKFEPKIDSPVEAQDPKAKNPFDSLEEEMASLLGRQPGKT
jgi:hypothetical protein